MKKNLVFVIAMALVAVAQAGAVTLVQPVSHFSPKCGYAPVNQQSVAGISDATVTVQARGYSVCGSSGRGGGNTYVYWCHQLVLSIATGAILSETVSAAPTYAGYGGCPQVDTTLSYANDNGVIATTEEVKGTLITQPVLIVP